MSKFSRIGAVVSATNSSIWYAEVEDMLLIDLIDLID